MFLTKESHNREK